MQRHISIFGRFLVTNSLNSRFGVCVNSASFYGKRIRNISQAVQNHHKKLNGIARRKLFNINDLLQHINSGKIFYLKQLTNVFNTIEFEKLNGDEAMLLLKYCGSVVADSSRDQRNSVCQDIFKGLQEVKKVNTDILNRYIKTCTENAVLVYNKDLLLKCEPDRDTYKLLLENVCQFGKIEDAFGILEIMKNNLIPLDSDSTSNLILAHALTGGLKSAETALKTIRSAHIAENNNDKLALFHGLIRRGNPEEFKQAVEKYPLSLTENELLELIEELGLHGLESWLTEVHSFCKHIAVTRDLQAKIERICIHLIHMEQPISAMNIYKDFVKPYPNVAFGFTLLKEMLHCDINISIIITLARNLVEQELNPYILESLTELALKFKYEEQAWALLKSLKVVKPHYFWPLLVHYGRTRGENGVFCVLKRAQEFNVRLDAETLEQYVFPYCSLPDLKLLMLKLQEVGFNIREILSPLLIVLLKQRKTKNASELCRLYNVDISGEGFIQLLARSWALNKDSSSVLILLARYCESHRLEQDLVGSFLIYATKYSEPQMDLQAISNLLKLIGKNRLRVTTHSADVLQERFRPFVNSKSGKELIDSIHSLVDFGLNMTEDVAIPHPRTMDLDGLECHLIELQEKNMETRGTLRRLIQMHANKGNVQRVKDLRQLFLDSGYGESPGIKSSIMHSYIMGGNLEEAMELYDELRAFYPEFYLDSFKFIDLTKLLIEHDRFEEGCGILQSEISKYKKDGSIQSIERNCRNLLNTCKNADQIDKIFSLLSENGICKPTNVMLGPLVRIHLKNGDVDKAVEKYIEICKNFKCTPLQFEMFCAVAQQQNSDQLERILRATEAVHGSGPTQVGLIAALAENGQGNPLKRTLSNLTAPIHGLLKNRCERWVEERKIDPLKCLAKACDRVPQKNIDVDFIYKCIFYIYDLNCDCEGLLAFFESLPEEVRSIQLEQELHKICDKNRINSCSVEMKNIIS